MRDDKKPLGETIPLPKEKIIKESFDYPSAREKKSLDYPSARIQDPKQPEKQPDKGTTDRK